MKNFEKYKTIEERAKAFNAFCKEKDNCTLCKLSGGINANACRFAWLDLEYEEEPKSVLTNEIMEHLREIVKLVKKSNTDIDYITCSYWKSEKENNYSITAWVDKEIHLFNTQQLDNNN